MYHEPPITEVRDREGRVYRWAGSRWTEPPAAVPGPATVHFPPVSPAEQLERAEAALERARGWPERAERYRFLLPEDRAAWATYCERRIHDWESRVADLRDRASAAEEPRGLNTASEPNDISL